MDSNNPLQKWINEQLVPDKMIWKGAFGAQVGFMRDVLVPLAAWGMDFYDVASVPEIVGTHRSKSITLPVLAMNRPDLGLRLIVRENFFNWKLSVISEKPIIADFSGLFHTTPPVDPDYTGDSLASCYFEGFPKDLVFGYYEPSDKRKWSCEINGGDNGLYTTIFLIMRSLGVVKPFEWSTKESHRKKLDAEAARNKARREKAAPSILDKIENVIGKPDE